MPEIATDLRRRARRARRKARIRTRQIQPFQRGQGAISDIFERFPPSPPEDGEPPIKRPPIFEDEEEEEKEVRAVDQKIII